MRHTDMAEHVFGNRSRVRVLRLLLGVSVPLNASQIAARTNLSQPAVSAALNDLAAVGVVASSPAGRAWVHWIVEDNVYVSEMIRPVFEAEQAIPQELLADLERTFGAMAVSVVLFGSYARNDITVASDIDVVLVGEDADAKEVLQARTSEVAGEFATGWGATLSPLVYDLMEAATLSKRAPDLYSAIEQDGITASGLAPSEWGTHA
jgi:predicted nucleotidyltransferase